MQMSIYNTMLEEDSRAAAGVLEAMDGCQIATMLLEAEVEVVFDVSFSPEDAVTGHIAPR